MPRGQVTVASDEANSGLLPSITERLNATAAKPGDAVDVLLCSGAPKVPASHIVLFGPVTDELDDWDRAAAPQTIAGALWVPQEDAEDATVAWLQLRLDTPTTPLSDLTDTDGRALRWSVVSASLVALTAEGDIEVDEAEIRAWLDGRPEVHEVGRAIDGIGGVTAQDVLDSMNRFRAAVRGLDDLADIPAAGDHPDLDQAVAEQLRQVQRTGFGRWRSARARAESQAATTAAAKSVAADRLRSVIEARREELLHIQRAQSAQSHAKSLTELLESEVAALSLPVEVDFDRVPRSWAAEAPSPRRYVLVNPERLDTISKLSQAAPRPAAVPMDAALCMVIQSGFSLPAVR
ncbi:MAG: hypothetical protein R2720_05410 [Candidatus Nanopelagicales bacterium]